MINYNYYENEQWKKSVLLFEDLAPYIKPDPIVFLGDSNIRLFRANEFIHDKYVINRGIDGEITTGLLQRLPSSVFNIKASRLFILIGGNDLPIHSDDKILSNYKEILINIISNLPSCSINVISLFPTKNIPERPNSRIFNINSGLEEICNHFEISYINFHPMICDEKMELKNEFSVDGLHLNQSGYNLLSKFIKNHL